jgi:hypothetical protein
MKSLRCLLLMLLAWPVLGQQVEKQLPDLQAFLQEFQVKRTGIGKVFMDIEVDSTGQYTYTETCTEFTLDSAGTVKSTKKDVFEIIPTGKPYQVYRRQTVKAGRPLSQKELDKQDREFKEQVAKEEAEVRKRAGAAAAKAASSPRPAAPAPAPPKRESLFLAMYEFKIIRREVLDNRPVILLTFNPKPDFKPQTSDARILHHAKGKVWVSEDDYELARIEAELVDGLTFGSGILAKIQKGSGASMEWRKANNEVWLPYRREVNADGRILLLKGLHEHVTSEFSGYRKYTVDTQFRVTEN